MPCGGCPCSARGLGVGLVLSFGLGVLTLTASFVVPDRISAVIKRRIKASVEISTQAKFLDKFGNQDAEAVVTLFNLTNARAVQLGKEKPKFSTVALAFDVHTERYDPAFVQGGSAVEYRSWTRYTVKAADKALYENGTLIVPNAQYIAGIHQRFGSEFMMQMGMIDLAVRNVGAAFTRAVPLLFQFSALPTYLVSGPVSSQGNSNGNFTTTTATTTMTPQFGNLMTHLNVTSAEASALWGGLTKHTSVFIAWYACAGAAGPSNFLQCVKPGTPGEQIMSLFGSGASLTGQKMGVLLQWLATLLNSGAYLSFFKAAIVPNVAAAQAATSFQDLGLLQFGSGAITQAIFGQSTVDGLGILPKPLAGKLEVTEYGVPSLTVAQSRAFVDTFSVRANVLRFLKAVKGGQVAAVLPLYATTGMNAQNWLQYALYLSTHLVQTVLVKGLLHGGSEMDADGVYPGSNSGMFCKLTPKQVLEGWRDPLIAMVESAPYYGLLGEQFASKEAKDAKKGTKREYGMSTGVGSASGRVTLWKGITKFHRRDELPDGNCSDGYTTRVRKDGNTCFAWQKEEVIAGSGSGAFLEPFDGKINHHTYKHASTGSATARLWSGPLFRSIEIEQTGERTSGGVRLEHFSLSEKTWLGGDCNLTDACNAANKDYLMSAGDAVFPLETVKEGVPLAMSMPYFLTPRGPRSDLRRCMDNSSFPTEYKEEEHGMYWRFEPLSGAIAEGGSFRQVNLKVNSATFGSLHSGVFTAMGCGDAFFPLAIVGARKTIGGSLQDQILYAYKVVVIGYAVSITCDVICAISFVLAAVLSYLLVRSRGKDAMHTSPRPKDVPVAESDVPENPAEHGHPSEESMGKGSAAV